MVIRKSHPIVEAGYKLSLAEQRIILLSLAKLDNRNIEQSKVTLCAKDYAEHFGVDEKTAYRDLKSASKRLYDRSIILKGENETTEFRWIESRTRYHSGEGRISFEFSRRVLPYLFELDKKLGYTQYQLLSVSGFSSIYSIRLYELFKKLQGMQNQVIEIDEIRRILQLDEKYSEFKFFKRDVLNVALKEINAKSDLLVEIEPQKQGRKIIALSFKIAEKSKIQTTCKPKFPHKNKFGKFVKFDPFNPKNSSHEFANYALACIQEMDKCYENLSDVPDEYLLHYYNKLRVNESFKSKFGRSKAIYEEIQKRGFKVVNSELKKD